MFGIAGATYELLSRAIVLLPLDVRAVADAHAQTHPEKGHHVDRQAGKMATNASGAPHAKHMRLSSLFCDSPSASHSVTK